MDHSSNVKVKRSTHMDEIIKANTQTNTFIL